LDKECLIKALDKQISVIGKHFADARRGFRDREISGPQFFLLRRLRDGGPDTISGLADRMELNQTTISNVVLSLHESGYVAKEKDTRDRRVTRVAISDAGLRSLQDIETDRTERMRRLFSHLTEDDLEELLRILEKLRRSLEEQSTSEGS